MGLRRRRRNLELLLGTQWSNGYSAQVPSLSPWLLCVESRLAEELEMGESGERQYPIFVLWGFGLWGFVLGNGSGWFCLERLVRGVQVLVVCRAEGESA